MTMNAVCVCLCCSSYVFSVLQTGADPALRQLYESLMSINGDEDRHMCILVLLWRTRFAALNGAHSGIRLHVSE